MNSFNAIGRIGRHAAQRLNLAARNRVAVERPLE